METSAGLNKDTRTPSIRKISHLDLPNSMPGEIPPILGDCTNLERLYLGGNQFDGSIPLSMSHLRVLTLVTLSRSNFPGEIPRFPVGLTSIEVLIFRLISSKAKYPTEESFLTLVLFSSTGVMNSVEDLPPCNCRNVLGQQHGEREERHHIGGQFLLLLS